eukprot:202984_1
MSSRKTRSQIKRLRAEGLYDSNDESYTPIDQLKWNSKKKQKVDPKLTQKMQHMRDCKKQIKDDCDDQYESQYAHLWNADTHPNPYAHPNSNSLSPPHIKLIPDKITPVNRPKTRSQSQSLSKPNNVNNNTSIVTDIEIHDNIQLESDSDFDEIEINPLALEKTYRKNATVNKRIFCESFMNKIPNNKLGGKHSLWHLDTLSNKYKTCDCEVGYKIVPNANSKWNCGLCESYDVVCNSADCDAVILPNIQNSLWLECTDIHNIDVGINYKNNNNRPNNKTQRCVPVTNILLQNAGS